MPPDRRRNELGAGSSGGRRQLRVFLGWFAAGFVLLLLLLTLVTGDAPDASDTAAAEYRGSAIPCQMPLGWRVGEIDPAFDVTPSEVIGAAHRAASLWETVSGGQRLFRRDDRDGIPIHLAFDRRQADLQEQTRKRQVLDSLDAGVRAMREELRSLDARLRTGRERFDRRLRDLNRRISRFNERAERLDREGASESAARDLERTRERLATEQEALRDRQEELEQLARRAEERRQELQRRIRAYNRRAEEVSETSRSAPVIAGTYDEEVTTEDGEPVAVEGRTITVFRFADREALARIIAHELGHALGLGHSDDSTSVMAATAVDDAGRGGPLTAGPADVAMLRDRCPGLVGGG